MTIDATDHCHTGGIPETQVKGMPKGYCGLDTCMATCMAQYPSHTLKPSICQRDTVAWIRVWQLAWHSIQVTHSSQVYAKGIRTQAPGSTSDRLNTNVLACKNANHTSYIKWGFLLLLPLDSRRVLQPAPAKQAGMQNTSQITIVGAILKPLHLCEVIMCARLID